jgi:bacterial/archaeal transporter family protein
VKHLPVSLSSPVRATGPVWTLIGALMLLGERPAPLEYVGVAITLASFVALSFAGRKDGVTFHKDKWIGWMLAGTLLGAASGLYDRHLLSNLGYTAATVQAWFSIYLAVVFFPLVIGWKQRWWARNEFHWRWTIPWIGLILLAADFLYFAALQQPEAMIALVSSLRRGSVLVTFAGGMLLFGEKHGRAKLPAVIGILVGILITTLG